MLTDDIFTQLINRFQKIIKLCGGCFISHLNLNSYWTMIRADDLRTDISVLDIIF
jgi:hypothetical protein